MYKEILNQLKNAQKPIIFVGNGVRLAHAEEYLYKLLEDLQIPILTTWRSMDLFEETHPLYVGRPGGIGERGGNTTLQTCDFLLCLGCRLDLASVAFDYKNFAPKATKIVVDIDAAELSKLDFPRTIIQEDLKDFLFELGRMRLKYQNEEWLAKCKELHDQPIETIKSDKLSLYQFIEQITPYLEDKTVVVGSSGTISEVFCQSFKVPKGCRIIQSNGLGSMGFGLPAAIGVHYASGKPVIMLDGDGSFAMNTQELSLVAGAKLPIAMIIINNGGYVSIRNTQDSLCEGRQLGVDNKHGLYLPNYERIANSYNIEYWEIIDDNKLLWDEMLECICDIRDNEGPLICEVFTDPRHKTQCRTTTVKQADGTLKASGLENLWP